MSATGGVERRAELILSDEAGGTVRLRAGSTYIGRGEAADIRIDDPAMEDKHLELDWDGKELWLIHLGQGPRPQVNEGLVAEALLQSGDTVSIGDQTIRVRILRRGRPAPADEPATGAGPTPDEPPAAEEPAEAGETDPDAAAAPPVEPSPDDQVLLEYSVHLIRDQPRRGLLVGAGLLLFFLLMWFFVIPGNVFFMFVAVIVIVGSVGAFVFPLRYRITEAGVEIQGTPIRDRKRWSRFEQHVVFPDAVQLLLPQTDIRGRIVKGSLIYFGDHREEVMAIVRERVPKGGPPRPRTRRRRRRPEGQAGGAAGPGEQNQ